MVIFYSLLSGAGCITNDSSNSLTVQYFDVLRVYILRGPNKLSAIFSVLNVIFLLYNVLNRNLYLYYLFEFVFSGQKFNFNDNSFKSSNLLKLKVAIRIFLLERVRVASSVKP